MHSYEIDEAMREHNHNIPSALYKKIFDESPQLIGLRYEPYSNDFEMWDAKGGYWRFTVYNDNA